MTSLTRRHLLLAAAASPALMALPGHAGAATHDVAISGMAFAPATITIAAGDTIRWTNSDGAPHTATFAGGAPDTGRLNRGDSAELTFEQPGTFDYVCAFHPGMRGRVIVNG